MLSGNAGFCWRYAVGFRPFDACLRGGGEEDLFYGQDLVRGCWLFCSYHPLFLLRMAFGFCDAVFSHYFGLVGCGIGCPGFPHAMSVLSIERVPCCTCLCMCLTGGPAVGFRGLFLSHPCPLVGAGRGPFCQGFVLFYIGHCVRWVQTRRLKSWSQ